MGLSNREEGRYLYSEKRNNIFYTEFYAAKQSPDPLLHLLSKPGGGKRLPRLLLIKLDRACNESVNSIHKVSVRRK